MAWTKERVEQLRKLKAAGLTLTQMAADLNATRGAVAGMLNRLGLMSPRYKPQFTAELPKRVRAKKPEAKVTTFAVCSKPEPKQLELPKSSMVLSPIIKDVVTSVYGEETEPRWVTQPTRTNFSFGNVVFTSASPSRSSSKAKALYEDLHQAVVNTRSLQDKMDGK